MSISYKKAARKMWMKLTLGVRVVDGVEIYLGKVTNIEYRKIDFENDIIETVTSTPF